LNDSGVAMIIPLSYNVTQLLEFDWHISFASFELTESAFHTQDAVTGLIFVNYNYKAISDDGGYIVLDPSQNPPTMT
jgi:hypothetical protein